MKTTLNQKLYLFALDKSAKINLQKLSNLKIYVNGVYNDKLKFKDLFEKAIANGNIVKGYSFLQFASFGNNLMLGKSTIQMYIDGKELCIYKIKNPMIIGNDLKVNNTLNNFVDSLKVDFLQAVSSKFEFINDELWIVKQFNFLNKNYLFAFHFEDEPYLFTSIDNSIESIEIKQVTGDNGNRVYEVSEIENKVPSFSIAYNILHNRLGTF